MVTVTCINDTDPRMAAISIGGVHIATVNKDVYDILVGPLGLPLWPCGE